MRRRAFLFGVGGALAMVPWWGAGCGSDGGSADAAAGSDAVAGNDAAPADADRDPPDADPTQPDARPLPDARPPADASTACLDNGAAASGAAISSNHGHSLVVPAVDVDAGAARTYSIQGASLHDHTVTVTEGHFTTLQMGLPVTIQSSVDGHSHQVTITCSD